jgi:CheY-like chemotaxis protein
MIPHTENGLRRIKKIPPVPIVTVVSGVDVAIRVLLVDDDRVVRAMVSSVLALSGFQVTSAANVAEALSLICSDTFDVLLSDLHMPGAGDGLTVVSAMRHANPRAVTLLLSAFPQMAAASQAIVLQADEILTKPMDMGALVQVIRQRVAAGPVRSREILGVDEILARHVESTLRLWIDHVAAEEQLSGVSMSAEQRAAHLPQLFRELLSRLRSSPCIGGKQKYSASAAMYGVRRRQQGYSAAMLVEESRLLQLSVFEMLQTNLANIDVRSLLMSVMVIADEIDGQLSQAMTSFLEDATQAVFPTDSAVTPETTHKVWA